MRRFPNARSFCFTIVALVIGTLSTRAQTWVQWRPAEGGNGHYYALTPTATNWNAAQEQAVWWGGTLVTITNPQEQNFINTTFLTGKFEHLPVWIGLFKSRPFSGKLGPVHVEVSLHSKDLHWVTGEALSWTNWKPGEPSDSPPGEDFVAMNWENSDNPPRGVKGDWNDTPLNGTSGYGGNTDGPYFGLVERETDPIHPIKEDFKLYAVSIGLILSLAAILMFKRPSNLRKPR